MVTRKNLTLAFVLSAATAGSAHAGSVSDLGLSLEQIRELNAQLTAPIAAPGVSFGSPTGFGAGAGQAFAGIGGQTVPAGADDVDGSALLGLGLGDPHRYIALEAAMNIISLQDTFAEDGNWNFKVHRMLGSRSSVAIGIEDTGGWGAASQTNSSAYAVYTRAVDLDPGAPKRPMTLAWNIGLGNERFADPDSNDVSPFGSLSLAWHRQMSAIVDWDGRDLSVGASIVPFYRIPLVVTAGFINLTERFEDTEFAGGAGYLFQF